MGLYIVATPIGNLEDITFRALRILREVDFILCENPRHSLKLLNHYQIKKPLISYHQHASLKKLNFIINLLKENKKLALISDAGTPGIADPGNELIEKILKILPETEIIAIPGPSSLIASLSLSGFPTNQFLFLGFPPKKKRNRFFQKIKVAKETVIFYESPYRLKRTLKELASLIPEREAVIVRELTKIFEKIYRGKIKELSSIFEKEKPRGEFIIIVKPEF